MGNQAGKAWSYIYSINPMASVLDGMRWALVRPAQPRASTQILISVASASLLLVGALALLPARRATISRTSYERATSPSRSRASASASRSAPTTGGYLLLTEHDHRPVQVAAGGRPKTREFWALQDVDFEVEARRDPRHHRPQRRRQEHPAQDPLPDHARRPRARPASTAGSALCSRSAPASIPSSPAARTSS